MMQHTDAMKLESYWLFRRGAHFRCFFVLSVFVKTQNSTNYNLLWIRCTTKHQQSCCTTNLQKIKAI